MVSALIVLLALTLCLSYASLVHAQTATNQITTVTPFSLSFLSGQAGVMWIAVKNPTS